MAWLKWDKVIAPYNKGGLNVGSLKAFNIALIYKWRWRYLTKPNDMWVTIIKSIHGSIFEEFSASTYSIWKNIVSTCLKNVGNELIPTDIFRLQIGNGCSIRFWHDLWCGNSSLASRYNRLFHLDTNSNDFVVDKFVNGDWKFSWTRDNLRCRNELLLHYLLDEIGTPILRDNSDSWLCTICDEGSFTVKDLRIHIDSKILTSSPVETLWYKFVPRKVNVFLWRFRLDILPVRWNLSAKGIDINSIVCPVCNNGVETREHLFFECTLASELWHKIRIWLDCGVPHFSLWDSFMAWIEGVRLQNSSKARIVAVTITSLWALWRFRNGVVFLDSFCSKSSLFDVIRLITFRWIKNRGHLVSNWNSWLSNPL